MGLFRKSKKEKQREEELRRLQYEKERDARNNDEFQKLHVVTDRLNELGVNWTIEAFRERYCRITGIVSNGTRVLLEKGYVAPEAGGGRAGGLGHSRSWWAELWVFIPARNTTIYKWRFYENYLVGRKEESSNRKAFSFLDNYLSKLTEPLRQRLTEAEEDKRQTEQRLKEEFWNH